MIGSVSRRIVPFMLILLVLLTLPMTAAAAETEFDMNKTGSICVTLRDIYHPANKVGGGAVLHKVGEAQTVNSNLTFVLTAEFAGSGVSLADPNSSGLAQQLADYAEENKIAGQPVDADANGTVTFSGLSAGLYLVVQTEAVDGYLEVSPFLVSLPMYSAAAGGWIYNIDASPKVQPVPKDPMSLTVVKKWLDNEKGRPESLTVQLLREGEAVETVELNEDNGWKYTWEGLNAYYGWDVVEPEVPRGYEVAYSTHGDTVTITNEAEWYVPPTDPEKLIQTGQLNWPVPVLACAGLCLLITGAVLLKCRRKENHEA